jgi:hypothetical protein
MVANGKADHGRRQWSVSLPSDRAQPTLIALKVSNPKAYIKIILFDPTPGCTPDSQIDPFPIDCNKRLAHKFSKSPFHSYSASILTPGSAWAVTPAVIFRNH